MPSKDKHTSKCKNVKNFTSSEKIKKTLIFLIIPLIFVLISLTFKNLLIQTICQDSNNSQHVQKLEKITQDLQTAVQDTKDEDQTKRKPTYIACNRNGTNAPALIAVDNVLSRLHMQKIELNGIHLENISISDWDLLWTWHHHTHHSLNWSSLKFHQKINHWPGNYLLISKSHLMTIESEHIPVGFLTADEVRAYAIKHPEKRFVIKLKSNRGVKLVKPSEMNFTQTETLETYFAQEFIENPLLWNGHKFDFSIFVAITSVDPLRVYYYDKTVNLRFTLKPYSTKDVEDVDSYVIGSQHITGQHFEPVKKFIDKQYTNRDAFENFMRSKGANLDEIWLKVENLIRSITLKTEDTIIEGLTRMGSTKYNHFELVRFDMIFNENLDLFLLEVNMSPNLLAGGERIYNKFMFENILFNLFNLIGVGTSYEKDKFHFSNKDVQMMVANPDGITTNSEICLSSECEDACGNDKCAICWHCLDANTRYDLLQAYKEQMNAGDFKRIFPPDQMFLDKSGDEFLKTLNKKNRWTVERFSDICKKNRKFC